MYGWKSFAVTLTLYIQCLHTHNVKVKKIMKAGIYKQNYHHIHIVYILVLTLCSPNATETLELAVTPAKSVTSEDNLYSEVKCDPPLTEQFQDPLTAEQAAAMIDIGVTDLQCGNDHFSQQVTHYCVRTCSFKVYMCPIALKHVRVFHR